MIFDYRVLPENSPLYPLLPYRYKDYEKISVFCKCSPEGIRKLLPSVLKPTSDIVEVFILKNHDIDGLKPYSEGGVVIPCEFNGISGGHVAFEWVTTDDALCAGREIWGFPKKIADVDFNYNEEYVSGKVSRDGKLLFDIKFNFEKIEINIPKLQPRLIVKRILSPGDDRLSIDQVICNEVENSKFSTMETGSAKLNIHKSKEDPIYLLGPFSILGATYSRGEFTLTYGKVVEDLLKNKEG